MNKGYRQFKVRENDKFVIFERCDKDNKVISHDLYEKKGSEIVLIKSTIGTARLLNIFNG